MTFAAKRSCGKGRKMEKQRGRKRAGNRKAVDKRATGRHERNKKIWGTVIGIAAVLLITGIGCAAFFLKSGKTPEETLVAYGELVNQRKYDRMYEMLSEQARERISEEEFTERNQKIYEGIEAENLTVQCEEEPVFEKGKKEAELSYTCEMESMAGKISFVNKSTFVKERGDWKINWDSTFIFPMLKEDYRVQINTRPAVRGNIYDRNGVLLAGQGTATEVGVVTGKMENRDVAVEQLAQLLDMDSDTIRTKMEADYVQDDTFVPLKMIAKTDTAKEEALLQIPGVLLNDAETRVYPLGAAAGHLTGYVQSVTAEDLEKLEGKDYHANSQIGKAGLEMALEQTLHEHDGYSIDIVNADGILIETMALKPEENGKDVYTTIDASVQQSAYEQFAADPAVAAAMDPTTGKMLALVSTPGYDPNEFIMGLSDARWKNLNEDPNKPLMNRFETTWVPGSTFKAITAAIGVESGKLDPNANFGDVGLSWQKDAGWGDYYVTTLTPYGSEVNLTNAMTYSDNIYFARVSLEIGAKTQVEWFRKMGFKEEMDFPVYLGASSYDSDDSDGEIASEIQLADTGYGQGELLVNPVHLLSMYSMFVNGGNMILPVLIQEEEQTPQYWKEQVISPQTAEIVKQGLIQVIENPAGTGASAKIEGIPMLGKTGTAEIKEAQDSTEGVERGWFICETLEGVERPLAVVGMVEDVKPHGGSGYVTAKVRAIVEQYYGK